MSLSFFDYVVFVALVLFLIYIVVRNLFFRTTKTDFLHVTGSLHWIMIGMSLIAADMSLEYIMISSSEGFTNGLAFGSYEWTASIILIVVALFILPIFMRAGITTIPEYLELRYDKWARLTLAVIEIVLYTTTGLTAILYSSGLIMEHLFHIDKIYLIWTIGIISALIIGSGGISAVMRTDFVFVTLLILGGIAFATFAIIEVGGFNTFVKLSENHLSSVNPRTHKDLPWTQVFLGSLWIMHLSYWSFKQFIAQKYLVSTSLSEAQKGILFAASLKLIFPFLFIIPGIVGFELFKNEVSTPEHVFPMLIQKIVPAGFKSLIMITFLGTIIAASEAIFTATTTLFTHDIYRRFLRPLSDTKELVLVSRISTVVIVVIACLISPTFGQINNVFEFTQHVSGAISPGLAVVFLFGFLSKKTPRYAGLAGLLLSIPLYYFSMYILKIEDFMTLTAVNFFFLILVMTILTIFTPQEEEIIIPERNPVKFERNLVVVIWSICILTTVLSIYIIFL